MGDKFCGVMFSFLHIKPLLKRGLLCQEGICFLLLEESPFRKGGKSNFDSVVSSFSISVSLKITVRAQLFKASLA